MWRKRIIILIVLLLLATAAAAAYYFYFLPQKEAPAEDANPPAEEGPVLVDYKGQYVKGEVPKDWTVVEYQNGNGSDMLTEGVTYTGLTGLEVKNPAGDVVFKLKAVYGIGGAGGCGTYFKFADDSAVYYNGLAADNTEVGMAAPTIVDLQGLPYSALSIFGTSARRVGTNLYWDTIPAATYFEAACGMQETLFEFTNPQFGVGGGETHGTYYFTVLGSASVEDLEALDSILNSLAVD
ncbi:MAG TPA: hypothetical protein VI794_01565 [Patescibacteria group bacterium]|nr:hypothetical protein [Patescibacteria group bacterium]